MVIISGFMIIRKKVMSSFQNNFYPFTSFIEKNQCSIITITLGLFDRFSLDRQDILFSKVVAHHEKTCRCGNMGQCVTFYRRCFLQQKVYHSLRYRRRKRAINYFIQFQQSDQSFFGSIMLFYTQQQHNLALIKHYERKCSYSDYFKHSEYYSLIKKPIDLYFFVLMESKEHRVIRTETITNHLIVLKNSRDFSTIIATPVT